MMKAEIVMVFLALLLIPAHIMAEEAETPEEMVESLQVSISAMYLY